MKQTPEQMALQHSLALCQGHADALQDALQDIHALAMDVDDYTTLGKQDLQLMIQIITFTPIKYGLYFGNT